MQVWRVRLVTVLLLAAACSERGGGEARDGGAARDGGTAADAHVADAGPDPCECTSGSHNVLVYLMSDDGELWSWDPMTGEFAFVVGPVCSGMSPFSMAVDARGLAWVLFVDSLSILTFDVNDPRACEPSSYVRRDPSFGLFGMSFASESETDKCASLYVHTYDGDGPFSEGPAAGKLGVIDPVTGELRELSLVDYDGGELTGTGDGRLYALAGVDPVKLVEYDKATGAAIETIPLTGFRRTNASAVAFHSGSIYAFIEATPPECATCLETTCGTEYAACLADDVCADHLACSIEMADVRDDCGGLLSSEMMTCLSDCSSACFVPLRARVSRVLRYDLITRAVTEVVAEAPIRVVGAATSPCVSTIPF